jgi:hypothetical protein
MKEVIPKQKQIQIDKEYKESLILKCKNLIAQKNCEADLALEFKKRNVSRSG